MTNPLVISGKDALRVARMMTLAHGLQLEIKGLRLTRGRTCYARIKSEFGLKGNRAKVLEQFTTLAEEAKRAL